MTSQYTKLKLISHRGNIEGSNPEKENEPGYVLKALSLKYDVEIDVWYIDDNFYLGHDYPKYIISESFLEKNGLWCHAKNLESLSKMLSNSKIHCFWHQNDEFTITSKGFIWTYPGGKLTENSICVLPEKNNQINSEIKNCFGICSDFLLRYKN